MRVCFPVLFSLWVSFVIVLGLQSIFSVLLLPKWNGKHKSDFPKLWISWLWIKDIEEKCESTLNSPSQSLQSTFYVLKRLYSSHYFPPLFIKMCPWYFPMKETIPIPSPVALNGFKHNISGPSNSFMSSLFLSLFSCKYSMMMLRLAHKDFRQCTSLKWLGRSGLVLLQASGDFQCSELFQM